MQLVVLDKSSFEVALVKENGSGVEVRRKTDWKLKTPPKIALAFEGRCKYF